MQRPLENIIFDRPRSMGNALRCRGEWKLARKVEIFSRREKSIFSRGLSRGETHGHARPASVSRRESSTLLQDDSFRNIFIAAAFRRYRFAQPTAKRRLSLRETLLMSSMGTARTATISIPEVSRSPFQAPLQLRDGASRETLRDGASRCRGEWKLARKTAGDEAGWDLPRQGQDVVNRGQRRRCARGAKHLPILRNPETGCTTPYHATTH